VKAADAHLYRQGGRLDRFSLKILVSGFLGVRTEPIHYEIRDGTHIFQIRKIIEGVVKPIKGQGAAAKYSSSAHRILGRRDVDIARARPRACAPSAALEFRRALGRTFAARLGQLMPGDDAPESEFAARARLRGPQFWTASGAALALLALLAAAASDWPLMFGFLGVALFVDRHRTAHSRESSTSPRACRAGLARRSILVVDFRHLLFVACLRCRGRRIDAAGRGKRRLPSVIVVTGAHFADRRMKDRR